MALWEASLALAPGLVEPLSQLLAMAFAAKAPDAAIERVRRQIALVPPGAGETSRGAQGEPVGPSGAHPHRDAVQAYEQALARSPRSALAGNNLAYLYSEHGSDKEKALQLVQLAKE